MPNPGEKSGQTGALNPPVGAAADHDGQRLSVGNTSA
jgi:hypothetical protein